MDSELPDSTRNEEDIILYTIDASTDEFIDEIVGSVSATGYRWVWLTVRSSVQIAEQRALARLKREAIGLNCDGVVGVTTSVTFFPGFLFFRGCAVHVTGTAVKFFSTLTP